MVGSLLAQSVDGLVGWLVDWVVGWLAGRLTSQLAGWFAGQVVGWLVCWLARCLLGRLAAWFIMMGTRDYLGSLNLFEDPLESPRDLWGIFGRSSNLLVGM